MSLDSVLLSRLQFAFTIGYHILWPAYTIGISGFIVVLALLWRVTRKPVYREQLRAGILDLRERLSERLFRDGRVVTK